MTGKVRPIPEGYHSVTPYLIVDGAAAAIEFYKKVFDATEVMRMPAPGGRIGHAEIKIGDSHIMLADENPEMNARSPKSVGGSPLSLLLYVDDVDKTVERAVAAGAKLERPVEDKFYGDRMGAIEDPFGHQWYVGTHIEDVSPEEMKKRMAATSHS
jgi:PhnB protein